MGKKLAIRGHSTRGKEVIKLLEMMGGKNIHKYDGEANAYSYYLYDYAILNDRLSIAEDDDFEIFTLQEFLEKFPYKVGDVIKFPNNMTEEIAEMKWDEELKDIIYTSVSGCTRPCYVPKNTNNKTNMNMNENKVESTGYMQMGKTVAVIFNEANYEDEVELQLGDYEIEVRDGKTYAVRKKPKYPKTYAECCEILDFCGDYILTTYEADCIVKKEVYGILQQVNSLTQLLICKSAYWKIAGEEMNLDKPWDSVYGCGEWGYWIGYDINANKIYCQDSRILLNHLLVFPSEEMRDAFYDNFKDLIEKCKELL